MYDNPPLLQDGMRMKNWNFESNSVAIEFYPLESSHPSSPLAHYSLYLDVVHESAIPKFYLTTLDSYSVSLDCNLV